MNVLDELMFVLSRRPRSLVVLVMGLALSVALLVFGDYLSSRVFHEGLQAPTASAVPRVIMLLTTPMSIGIAVLSVFNAFRMYWHDRRELLQL